MIFNTNTLLLLAAILVAAPFSARADSIKIVDWDVSAFASTTEGAPKARAFVGETVSWSDSNCPLVQFKNKSAFKKCDLTKSTTLSEDGEYKLYVSEDDVIRKYRYYGCGDKKACKGGSKLKVLSSEKKFEINEGICEGEGTEDPIKVITEIEKSCKHHCQSMTECLGFQQHAGEKKKTCTLYYVYPEVDIDSPREGEWYCASVQRDNTIHRN